ncbi:hypothetical protein Dsin_027033 [Dipteronia sinensis]|uniref:RNase H type-1 domain-containing protein n=1 Tax=Dipteronia sinensis TaxID=43782 RepID=A0AAE0DYK9_9ROSI|nr:hypothetical protein Dsin_027033 [Dipteronia sinensis]
MQGVWWTRMSMVERTPKELNVRSCNTVFSKVNFDMCRRNLGFLSGYTSWWGIHRCEDFLETWDTFGRIESGKDINRVPRSLRCELRCGWHSGSDSGLDLVASGSQFSEPFCFSKQISTTDRDRLTSVLKMVVLDYHKCYLGLPCLTSRSKQVLFDNIKEHVWKKLQSWSSSFFPAGGREVLLKQLLGGGVVLENATMDILKLTSGGWNFAMVKNSFIAEEADAILSLPHCSLSSEDKSSMAFSQVWGLFASSFIQDCRFANEKVNNWVEETTIPPCWQVLPVGVYKIKTDATLNLHDKITAILKPDALSVVHAVCKKEAPFSEVGVVVNDILWFFSQVNVVSVNFVIRLENSVAHGLAKLALTHVGKKINQGAFGTWYRTGQRETVFSCPTFGTTISMGQHRTTWDNMRQKLGKTVPPQTMGLLVPWHGTT